MIITLHYTALHCNVAPDTGLSLHLITFYYTLLHYNTSHYIMLYPISLHYISFRVSYSKYGSGEKELGFKTFMYYNAGRDTGQHVKECADSVELVDGRWTPKQITQGARNYLHSLLLSAVGHCFSVQQPSLPPHLHGGQGQGLTYSQESV